MIKQEGTRTVNEKVEASLKSILTPEQYKIYQESLVKK
jgi:hypothetical protein